MAKCHTGFGLSVQTLIGHFRGEMTDRSGSKRDLESIRTTGSEGLRRYLVEKARWATVDVA